MGFLNENDSLAYFAILGELSSGLSFYCGLSQDSRVFSHYQLAFSEGKEGHISQQPKIYMA